MKKKFPHYFQHDTKDCGPTCLKIISKYYNKTLDIRYLRKISETTRLGTDLYNLSIAAEKIGFKSVGVKLSLLDLQDVSLPCILHWNNIHYVVLYKIHKNKYYISDPAHGLISYSEDEFWNMWASNKNKRLHGVALLLEPTSSFYSSDLEVNSNVDKYSKGLLIKYFSKYKSFIFQLTLGLLASSILQLIFPFLTQSIVDVGIQNNNINFLYLVLFGQLFLFFGKTALEFLRSWILLHLSTRINISLVSDFFIKLMKLPISFFDVRLTGDILQRINDHKRIEKILTTTSLSLLFSIFNIVILGSILAFYSLKIFFIFFIGSILYLSWIVLFLKKREVLDYKRFSEVGKEQSQVIELINGMQEIKLHNAEIQKRWRWENIQVKLFKVSIKTLILEQLQGIGSNVINEVKNIMILFLSAKLVIDGEITLGMMLAISSIVGSLNGPITELITFIRESQDAKISLSRLAEIYDKKEEFENENEQIKNLSEDSDIVLKNINFKYPGSDTVILKNINLIIPKNKVTAIVGSSGSGKSTLMKVLLKFYDPDRGTIHYGDINFNNISQKAWRNKVGTVMQEGYIFNDSISGNIAIGHDVVDMERLLFSADMANIHDFVNSLPLRFDNQIGMEGLNLSTGQKQRLLIARAIYKNPDILFFDEATSSLDSKNEKEIVQNLENFFANKTVVIIAHRLSTVKNSDQIIMLQEGEIIEKGTHEELLLKKGKYFELVKNQLTVDLN